MNDLCLIDQYQWYAEWDEVPQTTSKHYEVWEGHNWECSQHENWRCEENYKKWGK